MRVEGPALLVRVYLGESDKWEGKNLYLELVEQLHERGFAGATVLRGIEGFSAKQHRHSARILSLCWNCPS